MKKYFLVYNPVSGDAYFKYKLDLVVETFLKHNCLLLPIRTSRQTDRLQTIRQLQDITADGIIVAGGDGTLHEVINVMLAAGSDLPLGIIPSGTANDFASYLQQTNDLERCAARIASGKTCTVDIGQVNDQYFINVASAGLLTAVAHTADTRLKNALGTVAYYLKGLETLPNFRALKMRINADGLIIEEEVFLFLIMNSSTVGSFKNIAPKARVNDGLLDLLLVNKCSLPELMRLFISLLTGSHVMHKNVKYVQAQTITIECEEELTSDLDGELGPQLPLTVKALSNKLRVFCD